APGAATAGVASGAFSGGSGLRAAGCSWGDVSAGDAGDAGDGTAGFPAGAAFMAGALALFAPCQLAAPWARWKDAVSRYPGGAGRLGFGGTAGRGGTAGMSAAGSS
ncbi:hypothetical protein ABT381_09155, partial [Streptomyces sp. NPDC000151]